MNHLIETLYYKSPLLMQNAAVSLMGLKLRRERYTPAGQAMLEELLLTQHYSAEQMLDYQSRRFVAMAKHAINKAPYYQQWAEAEGITAEDITSLTDIKWFPVIEKETIRANPELFRAPSPVGGKSFELQTSGTTGTPLRVFTDTLSRSRHYAFFSRLRHQYGLGPIARRATMFGRIIMPVDQKTPPFWRYDRANRNLLMSSYHLNGENLFHYYQKLKDYEPEEIFSYPSSLSALADYIVDQKLKPLDLKLIMTTAEALLPQQKANIEKAFNAPVVNQYGCTEMAFFAASGPEGEMRFHPEHGYCEVLLGDGSVAPQGSGELIATGLVNESMPIIRYRVGDEINLGQADINGFPKLKEISGRIDDVIYMSDGTPVGRLDPIFKGGFGIKAAQIEQDSNGDIVLRVVPDDAYSDSWEDNLRYELRKRIGEGLSISVVISEEIPRSGSGKYRSVISNFKQERN